MRELGMQVCAEMKVGRDAGGKYQPLCPCAGNFGRLTEDYFDVLNAAHPLDKPHD